MEAALKFTKEHEWVREAGANVVVGITDYAQRELGDVVFAELPEVGREVRRNQPLGVVESVKAVSDIYAPIDGRIVERNEQVAAAPQLVNSDPFGEGWLVVVAPSDPSQLAELLTAEAYERYVASLKP